MDDDADNKVKYYLFINSFIGVSVFIVFALAYAFKSVSLSYITALMAFLNIILIVYYYQYALGYKDSIEDFARVKTQSILRLISSIGFLILSIVMTSIYN